MHRYGQLYGGGQAMRQLLDAFQTMQPVSHFALPLHSTTCTAFTHTAHHTRCCPGAGAGQNASTRALRPALHPAARTHHLHSCNSYTFTPHPIPMWALSSRGGHSPPPPTTRTALLPPPPPALPPSLQTLLQPSTRASPLPAHAPLHLRIALHCAPRKAYSED